MKYFIFCFFVFLPISSFAEDWKPLPEPVQLEKSYYDEYSTIVEGRYDVDPTLSFSIRLPKSFTVKSKDQLKFFEKSGTLYGDIFHAYGPSYGSVRPYFEVKSENLKRMVSAKNWFLIRALDEKYTIRIVSRFSKNI